MELEREYHVETLSAWLIVVVGWWWTCSSLALFPGALASISEVGTEMQVLGMGCYYGVAEAFGPMPQQSPR